jgi:hypothetical protein
MASNASLTVATAESWLKVHERLLLVLSALVVFFLLVTHGINAWEAHDAKKVTAAQTVVAVDTSKDVALQAQVDALSSQIANQNKTLQAALAVKLKADTTISAPVAAQKLGGTSPDATTVSLPIDAARKDVAQLDTLPVVQQELVTETSLASSQQALIVGLQQTQVDKDKVCQAQIADLKVKSKKSFLRGLKWGFIAGVTLGLYGGHAL